MEYSFKQLIVRFLAFFIFILLLTGCGGGGGGGGGVFPPGKNPSGETTPVADITSPPGDITITEGASQNFQGSATEGTGPYTYSWSFQGGTPSSSTALNPGDVTFSTEGEYTVSFTVTDSDSHSGSDTVTITVVQANANVPDVVDLPRAAAEAAISNANLVVGTVSSEYSATVPLGNVISQDPVAGSMVQAESAVNIVVSQGPPPPPTTVPDVVNMAQAASEAAIIAAGLTVGSVYVDYHSTVSKDLIIRSIPASGTEVVAGSQVDLVLSLGPQVPGTYMNHKGMSINYSDPKYPTDSIWEAEHPEPCIQETSWEATSEYLYCSNPGTEDQENITIWSGTFTDVPLRRLENTDTDVVEQETKGLTGIVTRYVGDDENDELIGEININMISYAIQTGEYAGQWFAKASWEILTIEYGRVAGLMYMTCEDFNDSEVWGRVEGDIHGLYHADSTMVSVFSRVEIISIDDSDSNMFPFDIRWDAVLSETESWYANNVMYIQEGISWAGTGDGDYMNGDLSLTGNGIYLPFFNVGKYTGTWKLEKPEPNPGNYTGDMFFYLYLCPEGGVIVPFVEGLSEEGAGYVLNDNNIGVNPIQKFSSTVPVGHVISQTPEAGTEIKTVENPHLSIDLDVSAPTSDWKCVSAGSEHTLAIDNEGHLWAWGYNYFGQLGTGDTISRLGPVQIGSDTDWQQVSAGRSHSLAIKNGHLWAWGDNASSQLGDESYDNSSTPKLIDDSKQWSAIAAGGSHSLAIMIDDTPNSNDDKSLWAWGDNTSGQLGQVIEGNANSSTPIRIDNTNQWFAVAAGSDHSLGIADRVVYAWGSNEFGQLGIGELDEDYTAYIPTPVIGDINDHPIISISAGANHNVAIDDEGRLWSWGDNLSGQLGLNDTDKRFTPTSVPSIYAWSVVSAGGDHTLAKTTSRTFWAWGDNTFGQLGTGDTLSKLQPFLIDSINDWNSFSAGGSHSAGIKDDVDDTLWTWGSSSSGQLGNRTYKDKPEPDRI